MTPEEKIESVVRILRDMDHTQNATEWAGGPEIAWYYMRDRVEDALGLERGALFSPFDPDTEE
jgi:hypothetical protein